MSEDKLMRNLGGNGNRGALSIVFAPHCKGGTGKTTACINIAGCLGRMGKKVLVVDLDPHGSTGSFIPSGVEGGQCYGPIGRGPKNQGGFVV